MKFKLIIALVEDAKTELVNEAAREAGATGSTVITAARGEGLNPPKTFLGLTLEGQRDVLLFLVEEHLCRHILEAIAREARFDEEPGSGIAFQIDIEDAVGLGSQIGTIQQEIEDEI
ncbi:MAG: P-II family nitrogen regulator [Rhodospirillaceae bacterium]|jgi:nitrogen regulatory protein PII|nr:P-II family nitrogen regulator [Rhodospirillaceae bacterium]